MLFINPIEILELQGLPIAEINDNAIKKAKKRLAVEIDLSDDGSLNYKGRKLTKSDCENAIDALGSSDRKEYLYQLSTTNQLLNSYLTSGDEKLFTAFKQESIYKLPDFLDFISPYFAQNFDRSLIKAFRANNVDLLSSILRTQGLITANNVNIAFKSVSIELQSRINEIDKIKQEIKAEKSSYTGTTIQETVSIVRKSFPIDIINKLPLYFQSQINKIASSINYLQLAIWDSYDNTQVAYDLLVYLLQLNIDSVSRPTFEQNFGIVKARNTERIEREKNAPMLKRWADILMHTTSATAKVEAKTITAKVAFDNLNTILKISDLNNLPSFGDEIRSQIASAVRGLSIASWNGQDDIVVAVQLIKLASKINVSPALKAKLLQDEKELTALEKKYRGVYVCYFCEKNAPDSSSKITKTIYKENSRSWFPRRVQFSYLDVDIPRCRSCKEIHSKGSEKFILFLLAGGVLGALVGAFIDEHFIIGGILGAFLGWIVGTIFEGNVASSAGIKDASNSTLQGHPILEDRMSNGWTFSKPTA